MLAHAMMPKRLYDEVQQWQRTARPFGFCFGGFEFAINPLKSCLYMQCEIVEIEILSFDSQHISAPEAQSNCQQVKCLKTFVLDSVDE